MGNSFDHDPRGSTNRKLGIIGLCFAVVAAVSAVLMVAKSQGLLDAFVRVDLKLINIGDGLPKRSDVKFRGVIVGMVAGITPSQHGQPNVVHVDIQPQFAEQIPNTVTARVVPANIFAVSAVQLVDNGHGARPIRTGDVILEDQKLPTVLFQNVLAKLRQLLKAVGQAPDSNSVGIFAALSEATHDRGQKLTDAGRGLNDVLHQLNSVVQSDDSGPTTLSALKNAADSLRVTSPDLFAALDSSVRPMRTIAEKRSQLTSFLAGGLRTTGTLADAFDHQTDRMIQISTGLTPGLGVLADHAGEFHSISTRLQTLANKIYDEAWNPVTNLLTLKNIISINPSREYTRADCPRYGAMAGPSCQTAPETPTAPDLKPGLATKGMGTPPWVTENRPNYAPPRFSVPVVPDFPGPPDPNAPSAPQGSPSPGSDGVPAPVAPDTPPLPAEAAPPAITPAPVQQQSAPLYGGTVGPVGSQTEKNQLSQIVGGPATSATELLLGPVTRGTEVQITPAPSSTGRQADRGTAMRLKRATVLGLALFLVFSVGVTWMVFATLQRNISGPTASYSAIFSDVSGLAEGDDVRVAGVRVGRVDGIELTGNNQAKVNFRVHRNQTLYTNTLASVTYQNIIGQRYLGLTQGPGERRKLPAGAQIPEEQTNPSFDISYMLNGFEPLFTELDPKEVDNLTNAIILAFQGNQGSLLTLTTQASTLTQTLAGPDAALGDLIVNLDKLMVTLAKQSTNLETMLQETSTSLSSLNSRRQDLVASTGSITANVQRLSQIVNTITPDVQQFIDRDPGFLKYSVTDGKARLGFAVSNLPLMLKGLARITQDGSYTDVYACDLDFGLWRGLLNWFRAFVIAATPGNGHEVWHSAVCR